MAVIYRVNIFQYVLNVHTCIGSASLEEYSVQINIFMYLITLIYAANYWLGYTRGYYISYTMINT